MSEIIFYIFHAFLGLSALWLIISGFMSFRTKECTLYLGNKPFEFEGKKAIIAGIFTIVIGLWFFMYAVYTVYGHYTKINAG